tara:strand:+ start:1050 stop:1682 length:633 start_codon:yes stop_codon:yes gene_type:complete
MFKTIKISNQSTSKEIENATFWANYLSMQTGVPIIIELVDPEDPDVMEPKFDRAEVVKKPKKKKTVAEKTLAELAEDVDTLVEQLLGITNQEEEPEEPEVDIKGIKLEGLTFGDVIWAIKRGGTAYRAKWASKGGHFVYQPNTVEIPMERLNEVLSVPDLVKTTILNRPNATTNVVYSNQMCIVHPDNQIFSWTASVADMNADDWVITHS